MYVTCHSFDRPGKDNATEHLNTVDTTAHLFVGLFIERCPVFTSFVFWKGCKIENKVLKSSDTSSKGTRPDFLSLKCDSQGMSYIS